MTTATRKARTTYRWAECSEAEAEFWADEAGNTRGRRDDRHTLPRKFVVPTTTAKN